MNLTVLKRMVDAPVTPPTTTSGCFMEIQTVTRSIGYIREVKLSKHTGGTSELTPAATPSATAANSGLLCARGTSSLQHAAVNLSTVAERVGCLLFGRQCAGDYHETDHQPD